MYTSIHFASGVKVSIEGSAEEFDSTLARMGWGRGNPGGPLFFFPEHGTGQQIGINPEHVALARSVPTD